MLRISHRLPFVAVTLGTALCLSLLTTTGSAQAAKACPTSERARAVVKIDLAGGHDVDEVLRAHPVTEASRLVPSRGISVLQSTDPEYCDDKKWSKKLVGRLKKADAVLAVEPAYETEVSDGRFHAWPSGPPEDAGSDAATWGSQPAAERLRLDQAHERFTGAGVTVAVLDTGVSPHPALGSRVLPGWDYVDDDDDPRETRNGRDDDGDGRVDESFGHGTFLSGIVLLVAPEARVLPMRVLDTDGRGNTFVVAQAIDDAVDGGAGVISLSFGTGVEPESKTLDNAIKRAKKHDVVIVAAAGNTGTDEEQYPAADGDVVGVSALDDQESGLTAFSASGGWVDVAAPGERIAGPVPGGGYAWWSGTSVAAPFVAGQVALVEDRKGRRDYKKVVEAVTKTARKLEPKGRPKAKAIDILGSLAHD